MSAVGRGDPLCPPGLVLLSRRPLTLPLCRYSPLAEEFSCLFPSQDLPAVLSKFSLPVSLSAFKSPLAPAVQEVDRMGLAVSPTPGAPGQQAPRRLCAPSPLTPSPPPQTQLIQMVVWMLQHRLLIQLHTYACLMVPPKEDDCRARGEEPPFAARVGGRSLSTPNALSFGSPSTRGGCVAGEGGRPVATRLLPGGTGGASWALSSDTAEGGEAPCSPQGEAPTQQEGCAALPPPSTPASSDDMTLTSPSMDNSSTELLPGGDSPVNKRMTENLLTSLSEHERETILGVPAAQNPEDLRMFARWGGEPRGREGLSSPGSSVLWATCQSQVCRLSATFPSASHGGCQAGGAWCTPF